MTSGQSKLSGKKAVTIGLLVAVVAGVGYYASEFPPSGEDVAGTIAPAQRYRAEQIGSQDIQLGDQSIQQFMQTDLFEQIMTDEALREAISSEAFREAMNNEAFRKR